MLSVRREQITQLDRDTIVAIATPPGRGGIGVVRLSGPSALQCMLHLFGTQGPLEPRLATFTRVYDPETRAVVDEAVVTCYPSPHSYTGEDVFEIAAHGAPVVLEFLLRQALQAGARLARPGEFTERAFLNRRLDLTQAEAVRDLIEASTFEQAQLAAAQLGGALSRQVAPAKQALLRLVAGVEAGIDFAEDDVDVLADAAVLAEIEGIEGPLVGLERSYAYGRVLHGGLTLAIVGAPNVGKSSLFNRLLDRDRAIVTAVPGTTRDLVSERLSIGGVPVELVDTAGLRTSDEEVERMGIARSRETLAGADLVLLVRDASVAMLGEERELVAGLAGRAYLVVGNKVDLGVPVSVGEIGTSALTGEGIEELREAIGAKIRGGVPAQGGMLTNVRQHGAIVRALRSLGEAREAVLRGIPHEMVMISLYGALGALDELTGTTTSEDVLGLIFSTFCIGK